MALVEIEVAKLKAAAAKLPEPSATEPETAIDAGIRAAAKNNIEEGGRVVVPDQTAARVAELLAPPAATPTAATKPATKPAAVSAETKPAAAAEPPKPGA